jgi:hypothetical protein
MHLMKKGPSSRGTSLTLLTTNLVDPSIFILGVRPLELADSQILELAVCYSRDWLPPIVINVGWNSNPNLNGSNEWVGSDPRKPFLWAELSFQYQHYG